MVKMCVCAGCSNSCFSGHRVHRFPLRKTPLFRAWVRFVQVRRKDFTAKRVSASAVVCGAHFREEDYNESDLIQQKMGFKCKFKVRLKPTAVPSVHYRCSQHGGQGEETTTGCSTKTSRGVATRKLEVSRIIAQVTSLVEAGEARVIPDAADKHDGVIEDSLCTDLHQRTSVNRATQCNSRRLISYRSSGTQVNVRPDTQDVATQYEERDIIWYSTPVLSSPVTSSVPPNDQDDDFLSKYIDWLYTWSTAEPISRKQR